MRVLVVCHANRFRSPFAAGYLRYVYPEFDVRSRGVKQMLGKTPIAAKCAREAAREYGFYLEDHKAEQLNTKDVRWAEFILYMDGGNLTRLRSGWGALLSQTPHECLAAYVEQPRIPDPAFLKGSARDAVWALIASACDQFVKDCEEAVR